MHKVLDPSTKVKVTIEGHVFVVYKLCVCDNLKTAEGNSIKFHMMVKHDEKVCQAQNLDSHSQGQVHRS